MARGQPGDLFEAAAIRDEAATPLAERMRPRELGDVVGQDHLIGEGRVLGKAVARERIPSMILWGPPGSGKTTLARVVAETSGSTFEVISAVGAGVRELREVAARAAERRRSGQRPTVLFIDEIHRFNKAQQDALLPHVERGVVRLIGATTENPSFEVNAALLSRARVFTLRELGVDDLVTLLRRALTDSERGYGGRGLDADDGVLRAIAFASGGDARRALTTLEMMVDLLPDEATQLRDEQIDEVLGERRPRYDKSGEEHYNVVSAFIKSMRASDGDAAVYWLARMLEAGEDPMFVARRIVIFAAEDVGNADPQALVLANAAAQATHLIGLPEAVLPLSQATMYLSLAAKSNSALRSYGAAKSDVREHGALPVPLVIRNAVTGLMKAAKYGDGYRYPHDYKHGIDGEHTSYLPDELAERKYVEVGDQGWEARAAAALVRARYAKR